jgi:hypothetical protein
MLVTFLSPTLGWAMHATHEELAHAAVALAGDNGVHAGVRDHHGSPADHNHADPHSLIGHLFSHMPFSIVADFVLVPMTGDASGLTVTAERVVSGNVKPPFRPPLACSFAI